MNENFQKFKFCEAYPKAVPEGGHSKIKPHGKGGGGQ